MTHAGACAVVIVQRESYRAPTLQRVRQLFAPLVADLTVQIELDQTSLMNETSRALIDPNDDSDYGDVFVGDSISWTGSRDEFMGLLADRMTQLASEGNFPTWR